MQETRNRFRLWRQGWLPSPSFSLLPLLGLLLLGRKLQNFGLVGVCVPCENEGGKREGFWFYYIMLACNSTQKPYLSHAYLMQAIPSPYFDQQNQHFLFPFTLCVGRPLGVDQVNLLVFSIFPPKC